MNSIKLQYILKNAVDNSPYYNKIKERIDISNIESFPILSKEDIVVNKSNLLNINYSNMLIKECVVHMSSGTAGVPIEIYWHHNDEMRSNLSIWRLRLKFYGIKPSDRCCTLHTTNYSWNRTADYKDIVYSKDGKILSLCKLFLDDDHLKIYYDEVMKFKPIWLLFQPSVLIKFTEFIIKNKLTIPSFIKYIEFTGEVLTPLAVEYAEKYYNCNFANMYGTTETGTISYTCPYGNMHVLDDNVYLEIQKDQSHFSPKIGKAIVTSLNNNVFPLIRYDVGDIVSVIDCENCQCGLKGTVIETIMGRESRCVTLSSGLVISESIIISIFDRVNTLAGKKIKEYKAVINNSENLIVFMIHIATKDRHWVKEIEKQLRNIVYERFHFNFELIFTYEPICIDNNGKYSIVEVV